MNLTTKLLGVLLIGGALYAYHEFPNEVEKTVEHVGKEAQGLIQQATNVAKQVKVKCNAESSTKEQKCNERLLELPERIKGTPEHIITHTGYTLSHNRVHNNPNWVAWELTNEETDGPIPREDDFYPDPKVQTPHRVEHEDYTNSGYDRGHMIPAADMKWSAEAMKDCFYMSNICPQNRSLNSGAWNTLEEACRRWAQQEGRVYIICGPVYKNNKPKKIGKEHQVSVPDGFFKAVLSTREGHEKAIAFYYANRSGKQPMAKAAMSVDEAEQLTGINFFVNLPDELENQIEASYSLKQWQ